MAWFIYNPTYGQLVSFFLKKNYLGKWEFLVQEYEKFAQNITMSANFKDNKMDNMLEWCLCVMKWGT